MLKLLVSDWCIQVHQEHLLPCVSSEISAKELCSCSDLITIQYHPHIAVAVLWVSCIMETLSF